MGIQIKRIGLWIDEKKQENHKYVSILGRHFVNGLGHPHTYVSLVYSGTYTCLHAHIHTFPWKPAHNEDKQDNSQKVPTAYITVQVYFNLNHKKFG